MTSDLSSDALTPDLARPRPSSTWPATSSPPPSNRLRGSSIDDRAGRGLRPGPRRLRRRGQSHDARLRRQGRRRGRVGVRVHRRCRRRSRAKSVRPRGRVGRRPRTRWRRRATSSRTFRDPAFVASLATAAGPRHLDGDFELVQDTFRRFAEEKIKPIAEHIHRENADIPEEIIQGLAEMGGFGLSVPEEYGGFSHGRRVRVPRHGRRHRGAVTRFARRRRFADHPPGDPHPRAAGRGHRGTEAGVAAEAGVGRGHGRGRRHRARLRLRRRRRQGRPRRRPTAVG